MPNIDTENNFFMDKDADEPKDTATRDCIAIAAFGDKYFSVDHVIIGAGPAGLMRALTDINLGKRVIVLEKRPEDEAFLRPGLMKLVNPQKQMLLNLLNEPKYNFKDRHCFSDKYSNDENHRKSVKSIKDVLTQETSILPTKVIQRLLYQCLIYEQEDPGENVKLIFNSTIDRVDGRSQVLSFEHNKHKQIVGFENIFFADGVRVFRKIGDTPRELLNMSLGRSDTFVPSISNIKRGLDCQMSLWLTLPQDVTEIFKQMLKDDNRLDKNTLMNKFFTGSSSLALSVDLVIKHGELFGQKGLIFYGWLTDDFKKCWFAGNVPSDIHLEKDSATKHELMKAYVCELLDLCLKGKLKHIGITANDFMAGVDSTHKAPTAITHRKHKQVLLGGGQTWEQATTDNPLLQLENPEIRMGLGGTACSIGDAAKMPNFHFAEGTNFALQGGRNIPSFLLPDDRKTSRFLDLMGLSMMNSSAKYIAATKALFQSQYKGFFQCFSKVYDNKAGMEMNESRQAVLTYAIKRSAVPKQFYYAGRLFYWESDNRRRNFSKNTKLNAADTLMNFFITHKEPSYNDFNQYYHDLSPLFKNALKQGDLGNINVVIGSEKRTLAKHIEHISKLSHQNKGRGFH